MGRFLSSRITFARVIFAAMTAAGLAGSSASAATPEAIVGALRIAGTVTGGTMPTNSADFNSMVASVGNGDYYGAALTAIQSQYGANYLLRRLALQMQNPGLVALGTTDSDATAFLMAHFIGATGVGSPSISKVWSNNVTCVVKNSAGTMVHAASLTPADLRTIDWRTALSCTPGQSANDIVAGTGTITIPPANVGGYVTLSDRANDTSLAQVGATAGTNLRYIENLWMIATGMDLLSFASTDARAQYVPRFVPENDPHFLNGNGQTACIACHGGGLAAINHGYATVADIFDFDPTKGFGYIKTPTTGTMKSLGSDANKRADTLACTKANAVCNADSMGVDNVNHPWDLGSTWGARGLLTTLGWNGPTSGMGLNSLGTAIGKAGIVYKNLLNRVLREICPLGALPAADITNITALAQSSDDIKQVIAKVASNPACR